MADRATSGVSRRALRALKLIAAFIALALVGLLGWAIWKASQPTPVVKAPAFGRFESAWASAMAKAGVEATFPAAPVDLELLRPSGRKAFEATFTPAEITALLNTYPYRGRIDGAEVVVDSADVTFPSAGRVGLNGVLLTNGSPYSAEAQGSVSYSAKGISGRLTALRVEGFSIGGSRRQRASEALLRYFNEYVRAAPGLTVDSAEIRDGMVAVKGFVPQSLENP